MLAELQRRMILWTSVLVVILGVTTVLLMLQPPSSMSKEGQMKKSARAIAAYHETLRFDGKSERGPASLRALDTKLTALVEKGMIAVDFQLPCTGAENANRKSEQANSVNQVRLLGQTCRQGQQIASTEIVNEANGYSATVFQTSKASFTTDYIALAPGDNRIRVINRLLSGQTEEFEWTIVRRRE